MSHMHTVGSLTEQSSKPLKTWFQILSISSVNRPELLFIKRLTSNTD